MAFKLEGARAVPSVCIYAGPPGDVERDAAVMTVIGARLGG